MELISRCTICDSTVGIRIYGNRRYCDSHFATFHQDLPLLWRISIITFGFIVASVVVLAAVSLIFSGTLGVVWHWVLSLGTTIVPTIVWFILLYRTSSRSNSELPSSILVLAAVAVLLAAAVVHPFQTGLLDLDTWLSRSASSTRLLGFILLKGFPTAFLHYFAILLITWRTGQFERRVDGVLFTLAMGLPYSVTLGVLYVLDHGTLTTLNGNLRLVSQQAAIVTSSLVLGYFLGQNRFQDMPPYYLSAGVAVTAVLNGLLLFVGTELDNTGLGIQQSGFSPWPGLVVSLLGLAATFAIVSGLMRRQNKLIEARLEKAVV